MRQEKIMKVIVNHALDPRIKLEPNLGNDRSWVWSAFDFASGDLLETYFATWFADSDIANDIKKIFEEDQKEMDNLLAGEALASGSVEADEVAEALAGLTTKGWRFCHICTVTIVVDILIIFILIIITDFFYIISMTGRWLTPATIGPTDTTNVEYLIYRSTVVLIIL